MVEPKGKIYVYTVIQCLIIVRILPNSNPEIKYWVQPIKLIQALHWKCSFTSAVSVFLLQTALKLN